MNKRHSFLLGAVILALALLLAPQPALAANDCTFTDTGSALVLQGDCTTDATIIIPDGYTLDGNGYAITAVDPSDDHFRGAVVANEGAEAHVTNLTVTAEDLSNACDAGVDRLRGIMFKGASGSITHNTVVGMNQGPSGCQEGNAIEVRNAPFDGTHPNTQAVEIAHNDVADYQKTGILANGDVDANVHHNDVGASATQENLAANSIQLGFGALGAVHHNAIDGNQWLGTSNFAGSAILIVFTGEVDVSQNNVRGNSDVGLFIATDSGNYFDNRIFDEALDAPNSSYDIGVLNYFGSNNVTITNTKVRGFETPYYNVDGDHNIVIASPNQ